LWSRSIKVDKEKGFRLNQAPRSSHGAEATPGKEAHEDKLGMGWAQQTGAEASHLKLRPSFAEVVLKGSLATVRQHRNVRFNPVPIVVSF
jgi:hypothetical protein